MSKRGWIGVLMVFGVWVAGMLTMTDATIFVTAVAVLAVGVGFIIDDLSDE